MIREEEKALAERRRSKERKIESLKNYIASNVEIGEKFETARTRISFRKSQVVQIEDIENLPVNFTKIKVEPDKTAIKTALKNGIYLEGCELVDNYSIQIK